MLRFLLQVLKVLFKAKPKLPPKLPPVKLPPPKLPPKPPAKPPVSRKLKKEFPKSKPSSKQKCPPQTPPNPYKKLPRDKILKSKKSYEKELADHQKKLADYKADPYSPKNDHLGKLKNVPPEVQKKIINGRIKALEDQMTKHRNELKKIEEALK